MYSCQLSDDQYRCQARRVAGENDEDEEGKSDADQLARGAILDIVAALAQKKVMPHDEP